MAADTTTPARTAGRGDRRVPRAAGLLAGRLLVAAALVLLGWSAWSLYQAGRDGSAEPAHSRDLVLRAGRQQIAALNSMDGSRVDVGLRRWLEDSTGPLHDQLRRDQPQSRTRILAARSSAVGSVLDAAVTTVDPRGGTATVIASVRVDVTPLAGGTPSVQRKRYEAGLALTSGGWKLASLTAVPVSAS